MTKRFEEVVTGNLDELINTMAQKKIKGEIVLVLDGLQVNEETINLEKFINSQNQNYSPSELAKASSKQVSQKLKFIIKLLVSRRIIDMRIAIQMDM